jgi:hypothetical protein
MIRFKGFNLQGRQQDIAGGKSSDTGIAQQMKKGLLLTLGMALGFTGYGCGNNAPTDDTYDDGIGWIDQTPSEATQEVDGITFKYSLLNEKGKPTNRFKAGENFSFHFEMTNQNFPQNIYYRHGLECSLTSHGLGRIITPLNETTEMLKGRILCTEILKHIPFHGSQNHFELSFPVYNTEGTRPLIVDYADKDNPITAGRYYTEISCLFQFSLPVENEAPNVINVVYSKTTSLKLHFIID